MKTALITTTINVPEVLKLYRACDPDVEFFITGDDNTPVAAQQFCAQVPNTHFYLFGDQEQQSKWKCSPLIGWRTVGRRNIATLQALEWGADVIVTIDDDNIPLSTDYFDRFEMVLGAPFSGIQIELSHFDPGYLYNPPTKHRGSIPGTHYVNFKPVVDAKIGAAMGLVMGDPDVDAITRMAGEYRRDNVTELARAGVAVKSRTVLNTQNTAFLRQFAPCWLLPPQWKRMDDIWASLIAQRVMRDEGYVVHLGQPFVYQQRNPHNLVRDLKDEMLGYEHTVEFADWLDRRQLPAGSVLDKVRYLYSTFRDIPWMPEGVGELGRAWCDDCEAVL